MVGIAVSNSGPLPSPWPAAETGRLSFFCRLHKSSAAMLGRSRPATAFNTRVALNATEGQALVEQWQPAAAAIDIGLPDLNGCDLCRLARAEPLAMSGAAIPARELTGEIRKVFLL